MSSDMYIVRSTDKSILEKAESGGAVTSILRSALEAGVVDGVVAVRPLNGNRFAGVPVLITEPEELIHTAGSLHCSSPNIPRFVKEYLNGASTMKLAIVGRPCDIRAIIELQKRTQIDIDNVTLIGLNCTGTLAPSLAKQMFIKEFKIDPSDIIREDIDDGKLSVTLQDGSTKSMDLAKLEKKGYGLRDNCRRCEIKIPVFADLACGKWGTEDEEKKATFIEATSDKGKALIQQALENGFIEVEKPSERSIELREEKNKAEIERAMEVREHEFKPLLELEQSEKLKYWFSEFNKCIKCFGCRDACPICYCETCILEASRDFLKPGEIPPDAAFPLTRLAHVADSCVNCGQCQDACPMELPLSKLFALLNSQLQDVFEYIPGIDVEHGTPLTKAMDEEMMIDDTFLDIEAILKKK